MIDAAALALLDGRIGRATWGHALQAAKGACGDASDDALVRGLRAWLLWQEKRAGVR